MYIYIYIYIYICIKFCLTLFPPFNPAKILLLFYCSVYFIQHLNPQGKYALVFRNDAVPTGMGTLCLYACITFLKEITE